MFNHLSFYCVFYMCVFVCISCAASWRNKRWRWLIEFGKFGSSPISTADADKEHVCHGYWWRFCRPIRSHQTEFCWQTPLCSIYVISVSRVVCFDFDNISAEKKTLYACPVKVHSSAFCGGKTFLLKTRV